MPNFCKTCYKEKINPSVKDEDLSYSQEESVCDGCGEVKHLVISTDNDKTQESLSIAECIIETQKHIDQVRKYIRFMTNKLTQRGETHDASKLVSPEVEIFAQYTKKLASLTFDSPEYKECLEAMKPALDHHYGSSNNKHHPEHFVNGVNDMSLIDIMEMICDWKAASLRQNNGNILKSLDSSAERFHIDAQLKQILLNTIKLLEDVE